MWELKGYSYQIADTGDYDDYFKTKKIDYNDLPF